MDYLDLMHKDYKDVTFLVGLLECWSCWPARIAQFKITSSSLLNLVFLINDGCQLRLSYTFQLMYSTNTIVTVGHIRQLKD